MLGREVPARGPVAAGGSGQEVDVLVRPEALSVSMVPGANGIVSAVTFRGAQSRVDVLLWADISVKVDVPSPQAAALVVGSSVEVTLVAESVLVDSKVSEVSIMQEREEEEEA